MNYTFNKSKLSATQLFTIEKMKEKIELNPKMRKKNLDNLFEFWVNKKGLDLTKQDQWNFLLHYLMELGFDYDEILFAFMDFNERY